LEAVNRSFSGRSVDANVGCLLQPLMELGIQILVVKESAAVEEILSHVADRSLHLPFGLGPIWPTDAQAKLPVMSEAQELKILDE
jgi:hypothetical protein